MKSVLFVEGDDSLNSTYKSIVDSLSNFKFITANDGKEALQKTGLGKFDLICLDFHADKISGVELLKALRETSMNRTTKLLITSPHIEDVKQKCKASAVKNVHFLEKPFEKEFLKATIINLTAENTSGQDKPKFNVTVDFLAAFVESVKEIFQTMLSAKDIKIIPKTSVNFNEVEVDISAQMNMITPTHNISIVLSMPKASYLNVVGAMLGEEFTEIQDDLQDAIAEVLNILYCTAQKQFITADLIVNKTPPKTVMGDDAWVEARSGRFVPIAITTSLGPIYMGFNIKAS